MAKDPSLKIKDTKQSYKFGDIGKKNSVFVLMKKKVKNVELETLIDEWSRSYIFLWQNRN